MLQVNRLLMHTLVCVEALLIFQSNQIIVQILQTTCVFRLLMFQAGDCAQLQQVLKTTSSSLQSFK